MLREQFVLWLIKLAIKIGKSGLTDDWLQKAKSTQEWYIRRHF